MTRICAWCGARMPSPGPETDGVTHGICGACYVQVTGDLPCPECGLRGDHEDWCQDAIDTEVVEKVS